MATRFYFQGLRGSPVPAIPPSANWSGTNTIQCLSMFPEKGTSPLSTGKLVTFQGSTAGYKQIDRQYVSPPLKGVQVISGYASGFLQVREYVTSDNVNQIISSLRLCSHDGTQIRQPTGWITSGRVPVLEFIATTAFRNAAISSGAAGGTSQLIRAMTGQDGDRLVLEIGYGNTAAGTSPQASARWGENGADVGIGQAQTTAGAGWFSLAQDLVFYHTNTTVTCT